MLNAYLCWVPISIPGGAEFNVVIEAVTEEALHFRDGGDFMHPDAGEIRLAVAMRGAGAERLGLPSCVRGVPGVG